MKFKVVTEEELDQARKFRTYFNYFTNIGDLLAAWDHDPAALFKDVINSAAFQKIQRANDADHEKVAKLLRNAWLTEFQICAAGIEDEYVTYANHWTPVQVYYAVYLSLRALIMFVDPNANNSHVTTLRIAAMQVQQRSALFPYPWRTACVGWPWQPSPQMIHLPPGEKVQPISNLSGNEKVSFFDRYAQALKTTRQRDVDAKLSEWKRTKQYKRNQTGQQKQAIANNLHPTTLFDFLYRLRIRSNYEDADAFLLNVDGVDKGKRFHYSMELVTWWTLLVIEVLIARHSGFGRLEAAANAYIGKVDPHVCDKLVTRRLNVIKALVP